MKALILHILVASALASFGIWCVVTAHSVRRDLATAKKALALTSTNGDPQPEPPRSEEWKAGFMAGVREGALAKYQHPHEDDIPKLLEVARSNYWLVHVALPGIVQQMKREEDAEASAKPPTYTVSVPPLNLTLTNVIEILREHEPQCTLVRYVVNGITNEFHAWLVPIVVSTNKP